MARPPVDKRLREIQKGIEEIKDLIMNPLTTEESEKPSSDVIDEDLTEGPDNGGEEDAED